MSLMSHVAHVSCRSCIMSPWANRGERGRAWAAPPKEAAGRASRAAVLRQGQSTFLATSCKIVMLTRDECEPPFSTLKTRDTRALESKGSKQKVVSTLKIIPNLGGPRQPGVSQHLPLQDPVQLFRSPSSPNVTRSN